ncbi:MAG TPA: LLM class flavin-dependent oxidoreductase, partial [Candidatus Limnocylindrales bacterium]|nr:LLM class flavin-dependent oxidoreductase [Candidatus Limnocylindrales bacterium]
YDERFDRFEDGLRIIAALLRTGRATHDGRRERAAAARLEPRGPRPGGLPIMVGAHGPRMRRLTAELADRWNGGLATLDQARAAMAGVDAACAARGRDPATLGRSVEVLVRTIAPDAGERPDPGELTGRPDEIAAALRRYAELGIEEVQVQLRPNAVAAVRAFGPVLAHLRGDLRSRR